MQLKVEIVCRKSPGKNKRLKRVVNGRYGQTSRAFIRYSYLLDAKMPLHLSIFSWLFHPAAICGTTQKAIARFDNTSVTPKSIVSSYSRRILSERIYDRYRDRSLPASFASTSVLRKILSQRIFPDLSRSRDLSPRFGARSRGRETRVDEFENQALARVRCGTSTFATKRRRRDKRKRAKGRRRGRKKRKESRRSPEGRSRGARKNRPGRVASDERTEDPGVPCDCSRMRDAGRRHVAGSRLCPALSRQRGYLIFVGSQDGHEKRVDVRTMPGEFYVRETRDADE